MWTVAVKITVMRRHGVARVGVGLVAAAGLVLTMAGSCGGGGAAQAPPATQAPASPQKPADGIPNNGDGDADG